MFNLHGHNVRQAITHVDLWWLQLKAGQASSVYFPIIPAVLGSVDVLVKAQSSVAADAVKRQLLVEVRFH